jgi:hypothetical protein
MKCPLRSYRVSSGSSPEFGECIKGCAWWDDKLGCCSILTIGKTLLEVGKYGLSVDAKLQ